MFFRNYSTYEGEPARLYRSPNQIRQDILDIKSRIETITLKLNVRYALASMIEEYAHSEPAKWIPALVDVAENAQRALDTLRTLKDTLDLLGEELEDAKWALGI